MENNWQCLLSKIKLELSSETLENLYQPPSALRAFRYFPIQNSIISDKMNGNINGFVKNCTREYVNVWKLCITQGANIFQKTKIMPY